MIGGFARCGTDCDDARADVRPGSPEVCDDVDTDCDGSIDEGVSYTLFVDEDRDGFGDVDSASERACRFVPGRAIVGEDCDDANPDVSPGAVDVCNGVDDDCDTRIDEGAEELCHLGDGIAEAACVQLEGEPAPRCVITRCAPDVLDCDLDPANGCEIAYCTNPSFCAGCAWGTDRTAYACDPATTCRDGACFPAPSFFFSREFTVRNLAGPLANARITLQRTCSRTDTTTTNASGNATLVWQNRNPPTRHYTVSAAGHATQVVDDAGASSVQMIPDDVLAAILAASPVPVDRRLGIVVIDGGDFGDVSEAIDGPVFSSPAIPATSYTLPLAGGRTRQVFVNVRPGRARVRALGAGDGRVVVRCFWDAAQTRPAPISHDVFVGPDAIVHQRFEVCGSAGVGGTTSSWARTRSCIRGSRCAARREWAGRRSTRAPRRPHSGRARSPVSRCDLSFPLKRWQPSVVDSLSTHVKSR
ncbi:MAG: putative metal-binding motif-containing protein [Myxococcota bacterium]|nr:putative metal-binding motif-containing protein [Myxococcota bacterium]